MIILNVTHSVDKEVAEDWISWMKDRQIPSALKSGLFVECRMLKILSHEDDQSFSYAVQYHSESLENIEKYMELEDEIQKRYGDRVLTYPTLLEDI